MSTTSLDDLATLVRVGELYLTAIDADDDPITGTEALALTYVREAVDRGVARLQASEDLLQDGPGEWPYPDLPLRTPHCPLCGSVARLLVGRAVHPSAFCPDDDCAAFNWDPTIPAARLLTEMGRLVEETAADGSTVWKPAGGEG